MNRKLEFDYTISFHTAYAISEAGRAYSCCNEILIPTRHLENLEEIVGESINCHRTIYILHKQFSIISIHAGYSSIFPPLKITDDLLKYEQMMNNGRLPCSEIKYVYFRNDGGYYEWKRH